MKCKKCDIEMLKGVAIEQTYTGMPDFPSDNYVCTLSPGGSGKMVMCLKCPECGYSVYNKAPTGEER